MIKSKTKQDNKPQSSATVVDGKLILTLPDAITPVVWQMDIDQARSAALEVQEDKKRKAFCLILRNTKGESVEVAPFEEKEQAVNALMMTSQALQNAHGKMRQQSAATTAYQAPAGMSYAMMPQQQAKGSSNKTGATLALALIVILLLIWVFSIPRQGETFSQESEQTASTVSGNTAESGVAVSADEFLSGNR